MSVLKWQNLPPSEIREMAVIRDTKLYRQRRSGNDHGVEHF